MSLDYNRCCYTQPWWGWWQWTQYWGGRHICEINCGNCVCTSSGAAPRGLVGDIKAKPVVKAPVGVVDCHCEHTLGERIDDFLTARMRGQVKLLRLVGRKPREVGPRE